MKNLTVVIALLILPLMLATLGVDSTTGVAFSAVLSAKSTNKTRKVPGIRAKPSKTPAPAPPGPRIYFATACEANYSGGTSYWGVRKTDAKRERICGKERMLDKETALAIAAGDLPIPEPVLEAA